jgi:hypothetical protein
MKYFFFLMLTLFAPCIAEEAVLCRDLDITYDVAKLEEELQYVADLYMPRFRKEDWTMVPLRNADATSSHKGIELTSTLQKNTMLACSNNELVEQLPYIAWIFEDIAARFNTEVGLVRISKVASHKAIDRHADGRVFDFHKGEVYRLHIPIITGENVVFEVDDNSYHLQPGTLYYTNVSKVHSVKNEGEIDRIHLIIDVHSSPALQEHILASKELDAF